MYHRWRAPVWRLQGRSPWEELNTATCSLRAVSFGQPRQGDLIRQRRWSWEPRRFVCRWGNGALA
eukprot:12912941-Prorocentrum_lima.AAC.1